MPNQKNVKRSPGTSKLELKGIALGEHINKQYIRGTDTKRPDSRQNHPATAEYKIGGSEAGISLSLLRYTNKKVPRSTRDYRIKSFGI